jgi:hypothetical protein
MCVRVPPPTGVQLLVRVPEAREDRMTPRDVEAHLG